MSNCLTLSGWNFEISKAEKAFPLARLRSDATPPLSLLSVPARCLAASACPPPAFETPLPHHAPTLLPDLPSSAFPLTDAATPPLSLLFVLARCLVASARPPPRFETPLRHHAPSLLPDLPSSTFPLIDAATPPLYLLSVPAPCHAASARRPPTFETLLPHHSLNLLPNLPSALAASTQCYRSHRSGSLKVSSEINALFLLQSYHGGRI